MTCHGLAWQGMARHDMPWFGMARHGKAWQGMARHGKPWHGKPWHGMAYQSMAWRGMSEHGINSIQVTHFPIETLQSNDFSTPLKCKNTFLKKYFFKNLIWSVAAQKTAHQC
jgi:hypothetical protein